MSSGSVHASPAAPRRIGLLGGSFDPVHLAHLAMARCARDQLGLDAVWLIPAGLPWQRAPLAATAEHRLAMLELATAGEAGLRICDVELRRAGPSYTVDTLRELQAAHPDTSFVLILGADQLARLPTWHDWRAVVAAAHLAVAARHGSAETAPPEVAAALRAGGRGITALHLPPMAVSATAVRERAAHDLDLSGLVPPSVARYIQRHRLYQSPPTPHGHP